MRTQVMTSAQAKEFYLMAKEGFSFEDAWKLARDRGFVDTTEIREKVTMAMRERELTFSDIARTLGHKRSNGLPETCHVRTWLGYKTINRRGDYQSTIHYRNAELLVRAVGLDPVDVGL